MKPDAQSDRVSVEHDLPELAKVIERMVHST